MLVLGIESSCDDTSIALLDCSESGHVVLSEKTASQIDIHKKYGGVVPEIAGRMHAEKIVPLIEEVLSEGIRNKEQAAAKAGPHLEAAGIKPDVIAVTSGPGLITGLIVGTEAAKTLSMAWNIPLIGTNHIEGHIHSVEIERTSQPTTGPSSLVPGPLKQFPALALVVSGGHTELILMRDHGDYTILGKTKDDAAGECFDKVAKLLELPYPGGPKISQLAATGRTDAIQFPRPMLDRDNFDFSFAGLKTSALYWLQENSLVGEYAQTVSDDLQERVTPTPSTTGGHPAQAGITLNDFCASFEQAIVDTLVVKTLRAAHHYKPKSVILAGGVSANKKLRTALESSVLNDLPGCEFRMALPQYCMDNGAMIAVAGYYHALKNDYSNWRTLKVDPNWKIDRING